MNDSLLESEPKEELEENRLDDEYYRELAYRAGYSEDEVIQWFGEFPEIPFKFKELKPDFEDIPF